MIPGRRRFLTKDPTRIISEDGNYFGFVQNNPVNYTDPLGLANYPFIKD
jgi:RHS repeat-associated protein